jgi:hypothetical protein
MIFLGLCAGTAEADAVTDWNNVVVGATIAAGRSNPETAIAAAYMHIAIYDAIAAIDGRYTPFLTQLPTRRLAPRKTQRPLRRHARSCRFYIRQGPSRQSLPQSARHALQL